MSKTNVNLENLRILMGKAVNVLDLENRGILIRKGILGHETGQDLKKLGILIRTGILDHEKGQDLAQSRRILIGKVQRK